ncbi:MAG: regulatory iron-sulfur-containing complex subunit RicT [Thermoleophilia bacterium]
MPELVEVVFRSGCKVYSFDPTGLELETGDQVLVRTSRGIEMGRIVVANHEVPSSEIKAHLEKVVRKATSSDISTMERNEKLAARAANVCEERIREYGLDMRLVHTEVVFDSSKIIVSFFAEERVDFRKLVEDLAKKFKTRIEFRQVGVRDEARIIGGYGPCGRRMCCTMFAGDQQPVSIKMAKEQNLPLNPMKISGICGRLMCCLKYEQDAYKAFKCKAPPKGTMVSTERGEGRIVDYMIPKEKVIVDLGEGGHVEADLDEIKPPGARGEKPKEPKAQESKPGDSKPREPRSRESRTRNQKSRAPRSRDRKPGETGSSDKKPGEPGSSDQKPGEPRSRASRSRDRKRKR